MIEANSDMPARPSRPLHVADDSEDEIVQEPLV